MNVWSFYDPQTGQITGRTFMGPARELTANTPQGSKAIEGRYDNRTQRVDVETGEVIDTTRGP